MLHSLADGKKNDSPCLTWPSDGHGGVAMVTRWVLFQTGPYCRVTDEERRRDLACSFPCGRKDDRRDLIENKRAFTLHYVPSALRRVLAVWCLLRDQIQRNAPKIPLLITFHEKKKKYIHFPSCYCCREINFGGGA